LTFHKSGPTCDTALANSALHCPTWLHDVCVERGLREPVAVERLVEFGANELEHRPGPTLLRRFVGQFADPLVALQVAVVHLGALNRAFETTPLSVGQWLTFWDLASTVLIANEIRKLIGRRLRR
jgi:magnesium-transporting ATPase (P-type)